MFGALENICTDQCKLTALILIVISLFWLYFSKKRWTNQPPGPYNLPIIGYLPFFLSRSQDKLLARLSQKYGPVIGFFLGTRYVVVLNDIASARETLNKDDFLGRPEIHPMTAFEKNSLFVSNGEVWKQEKLFALKVFHDLGFGKKAMEQRVKNEISCFMEHIKKYENKPYNMRFLLYRSINNNISSLLFGHRFDYDDPKGTSLENNLETFGNTLSQVEITTFFPSLKPIAKYLGGNKISHCREAADDIALQIREEIEEHKKNLEDGEVRSYLHGYLLKLANGKETTFSEEALVGTAKAFYIGGGITTATTIEWFLLAMIAHPEVQTRVWKEVDNAIGREKELEWSDAKLLPYTRATLLETERWRTIGPLSVVRCALRDTTVRDYRVPRGTFLFTNLWAINNDPHNWTNPTEFRPERFLDKEGKFMGSNVCIPFSIGRRSCPGESLGNLQTFLYSVTLVRNYIISSAEGADIEAVPGMIVKPKPFNVLLTPRP